MHISSGEKKQYETVISEWEICISLECVLCVCHDHELLKFICVFYCVCVCVPVHISDTFLVATYTRTSHSRTQQIYSISFHCAGLCWGCSSMNCTFICILFRCTFQFYCIVCAACTLLAQLDSIACSRYALTNSANCLANTDHAYLRVVHGMCACVSRGDDNNVVVVDDNDDDDGDDDKIEQFLLHVWFVFEFMHALAHDARPMHITSIRKRI